MAQIELPKEIAAVSGAISKRKNYDGSVTVTYFKTVNGKSRLYTHTYKPRIPNEKQCKVREALTKASRTAKELIKEHQHGVDNDTYNQLAKDYNEYLNSVSPVDIEKNRFKTFKGFIISQLFKIYIED